jgi:hypothetical protein
MDNVEKLRRAWGRHAEFFERWFVDASEVPVDWETLETLIDRAPRGQVLWRTAGTTPDARMTYVDPIPQARGRLRDLLLDTSRPSRVQITPWGMEELHPAWAALLRRWRDFMRQVLPPPESFRHVAFGFFLGGPGAYTQIHADPSHAIHLQIFGRKRFHTLSVTELPWLEQREIFAGTRTFLQWRDEYAREHHISDMTPGTSAYLPTLAPHWAEVVGDEPSLSISCGISTSREDAILEAYGNEKIVRADSAATG